MLEDRIRGTLARVREMAAPAARSLDWPLVILLVGFLLVAPICGGGSIFKGAIRSLARLVVTTPMEAYEKSIAAAAVKRPGVDHKLKTIDTSKSAVTVVTFRSPRDIKAEDRSFDIWVSLPDELRSACKGAADPIRKLQEVLGLPPTDARNRVVTEIALPPSGLFRPCFKDGDVAEAVCQLAFPEPTGAGSADRIKPLRQALDQKGDAGAQEDALKQALEQLATLRVKYDHLHFVGEQLWMKYRADFRRADGTPDYGYPFTGMGWTYDWSTRSRDHVGVSEFVVRRDVKIAVGRDIQPADFCK